MKDAFRTGVTLTLTLVAWTAFAGPLEDYVYAPDPSFACSLARTIPGDGYTAYVLDLTSQEWRKGDVTPSLWRHWVSVIVPTAVDYDTALLLVAGGNNEHKAPPAKVPQEMVDIALLTRSVTAVVQTVPSEPLTFADETRSRSEDEIIAYTFKKFGETGDATWPLLVAMVKSAVRAMDAIQGQLASLERPVTIDHFVVTGASKRGWTTWLTGAVDHRVTAIAPMVIDVLNMKLQMEQQKAWYGAYSEQVRDYSEMDLMGLLEKPEGEALMSIVDPYRYRHSLTKPKLVLLGAGDDYWTVDAAKFYFPDLRGPKFIRYQPNAGHGMGDRKDTVKALTAFYGSILTGAPMPRFTWTLQRDGDYLIRAKDQPRAARLWTAPSKTLDFRMNTIGEAWTSQPIEPERAGVYKGQVPPPDQGYVAFFIELVYQSPLGFEYSLTTQAAVSGLPEEYRPSTPSGFRPHLLQGILK